jgi:hypothetical protein
LEKSFTVRFIVLTRGSKFVVALALAFSLGAHWALLQCVAWVGMTVSYAQTESSFSVALEKTFDGKHPCPLCKIVDAGKKSEQKETPTVQKHKLELIGQETALITLPPVPMPREFASISPLVPLVEPPALPPPRCA